MVGLVEAPVPVEDDPDPLGVEPVGVPSGRGPVPLHLGVLVHDRSGAGVDQEAANVLRR